MRALTVWQPWATLLVIGAKPFEFRGWPMRLVDRERWAVHAAARKPSYAELRAILHGLERGQTDGMDRQAAGDLLRAAMADVGVLPLGAVVGTVLGGRPVPAADLFGGAAADRWANPVHQPQRFDPPIPAKGKQGWWWWGAP